MRVLAGVSQAAVVTLQGSGSAASIARGLEADHLLAAGSDPASKVSTVRSTNFLSGWTHVCEKERLTKFYPWSSGKVHEASLKETDTLPEEASVERIMRFFSYCGLLGCSSTHLKTRYSLMQPLIKKIFSDSWRFSFELDTDFHLYINETFVPDPMYPFEEGTEQPAREMPLLLLRAEIPEAKKEINPVVLQLLRRWTLTYYVLLALQREALKSDIVTNLVPDLRWKSRFEKNIMQRAIRHLQSLADSSTDERARNIKLKKLAKAMKTHNSAKPLFESCYGRAEIIGLFRACSILISQPSAEEIGPESSSKVGVWIQDKNPTERNCYDIHPLYGRV